MRIVKCPVWAMVVALPVLALATAAEAGTVAYQFRIAGNKNVPILRLVNKSSSANITAFTMTIGDTAFNFDFHRPHPSLSMINPSVGGSLDVPDLVQDNVRTESLACLYDDFEPGEFHRFKADIDPDSYNKRVNYQKVLFDLAGDDDSDNSQITVTFSDGQTLSGYLPDFAGPNVGKKFVYEQSLTSAFTPAGETIPLPAGLWAGLSMLGGLGAWRGAKNVLRTI